MAKLVLVRHGESEWNKLGLWQGWADDGLTEKGLAQARQVNPEVATIKFDYAYSSPLIRASKSLDEILKTIGQTNLPMIKNRALIERDYGIYTGKNKWEVEKEVGEEKFQELRRGWDYPIPDGESIKQVYDRLIPYYQQEILPKLKAGKNVIVSSHGNTLRTLVKFLDNLDEKRVEKLEIGIDEVYVYEIDQGGQIVSKKVLDQNPLAGKQ